MHFTLLNNYFAKMSEHSENDVVCDVVCDVVPGVPVVHKPDLSRLTVRELYKLIRHLQFYVIEINELMQNAGYIILPSSVREVNNLETTAKMFKAQIAEIVQALNEAIALIIKSFNAHTLFPVGYLFVKVNLEILLRRLDSTKNKFEALLNDVQNKDFKSFDAVLQFKVHTYILQHQKNMLLVTQYKLL